MNSELQEAFSKLTENDLEVFEEGLRLLTKIAENILKNPHNLKLRSLKKSNATISEKILAIKGGIECLKAMGFQEKDTVFEMDVDNPLKLLEEFIKASELWRTNKSTSAKVNNHVKISHPDHPSSSQIANTSTSNKEVIKRVILPPLTLTYTNPFLMSLERNSHSALQYEDKHLQDRAKKLIPVAIMEENAQRRLRLIQTHIKKSKLDDPEISIQDMLILELLRWFKQDFFTWVDSPPCESCGDPTEFSHMSNDRKLMQYTDRVELHRCKECKKFTPFPRYNDVNILLETRRGRCGEWANAFTLCCRAMGWDSRYVIDQGDHVWTEVYSITQRRWLHCDPCENICDTPLVYETGWNKKISYVVAYSGEDIQDVTWRYTGKHKEVLKRRTACSEKEFLDALLHIRNKLQKNLSASRRKYLMRRNLMELVEFLTEKTAKSEDRKGRTSGEEMWRIARGETDENGVQSQHVWKINPEDFVDNSVIIRYSAALNKYEYISGGRTIQVLNGWQNGIFESDKIFRKEEIDWKMVYLARNEGVEKGSISWKFDLADCKRTLQNVTVQIVQQTYETGNVGLKLCSSNNCIILPKDTEAFSMNDFAGASELILTATLSGGKGDTAWQHAQLFRQSSEDSDFNFCVTLTFEQ
ncbi:unnamed protein product [Phyllotreta striolata]|uniref:Peptide-N(4)-(N-acetyl-beta-glucosaminyl)asparagine amidase n=1 Tax=Phyllotreta striolata TaxID=444603 RepID=A0A9N9TV31_PHYSR|nr:unnamed protein product [Phyllotreta striolata]